MITKIIDTMATNDKQDFFYLVEYKKENGKKGKKWILYSEMGEDLKNQNICFCLTYTIFNVFDYFICEKTNMTRTGAIFESVNDFEQWKKTLKNYCEFSKLEILQ